MRVLAVVVLLGACAGSGSGSGGGMRPAVMPKLSELPVERERRDAVLDSAGTRAGPEHRRGQTRKERQAETTAATAAAVLGWLLSDNENVILGGATSFDENWIVDDPDAPPPRGAEAAPEPPPTDNTDLVPWVRLKTPPPDSDAAPAPDAP